jgi:hypothetical protein
MKIHDELNLTLGFALLYQSEVGVAEDSLD